jgi:hypothetical protein
MRDDVGDRVTFVAGHVIRIETPAAADSARPTDQSVEKFLQCDRF